MSRRPEPSGEMGPTWANVREAMEQLVSTWDGCVTVELSLAPRNVQKTVWGLWVRVVWRGSSEDRITPERAAGSFWPNSNHRTMPGMLFRLCAELDHKLTDLERDKAMGGGWVGTQAQADHLSRLDPQGTKRGG